MYFFITIFQVCKETQLHSHNSNYDDDDEYSTSEEYADSNDSNDEDDDEDEVEDDEYGIEAGETEKIVDKELEWDDTSLEIRIRDKQLQKEKIEQELQMSKKLSNKNNV